MAEIASTAWILFWRPELAWLLPAAAAVAFALFVALRAERAAIRNSLLFLALAVAAELAGAALEAAGVAGAGRILRGAGVLATGIALLRLGGIALFRGLLPAIRLPAPRIVEEVALVVASLAWAAALLREAGVDPASLVTTSAIITAVIAFSMQDTLGNLLGGLLLELDGSLSVGDWVRIDDLSGRVVQIRWRHTAIRTRNGDTVIVPNGALMKTRFGVIGNPDDGAVRLRRWLWFDVDYDTPPAQVIAVSERAVTGAEIANVAQDPAPSCVLMEFGRSAGRYALRYWLVDPGPDDTTDTAVRIHLFASLRRAGIALAMPQYLLHNIRESEKRQAALQQREIAQRVDALGSVPLFAHLEPGELRAVAAQLVYSPFAAGDLITRQGAVAHWLYLLTGGEAEVWTATPGAPRHRIATLRPGSVFGEMGLLTGEPRAASVTATTDVECWKLDKAGLENVIRERPAIAEDLSRVLAERSEGLREAADAALADAEALRARRESLLTRVRLFFGLESPP